MGKQTIYFSRHGIREDWGPHRKEWMKTAPRPYDPSLAPEGFIQAKELGAYYKTINAITPIDRILASPLIRTLQTATAIADQLDMKICPENGAMEWLGSECFAEPLPVPELKQRFPRVDETYTSTRELPPALSKENLHEWCKDAIIQIISRFPNETLIIVTHAAPLICLARGLLGPEALVRTGVCSVSKLVYNSDDDSAVVTAVETETQQDGQEKVKGVWAVEMNGMCEHLSKGEQFHWTF